METQVQEQIPAHQMSVMGREGDTKIIWDKDNEDEVDNARRSFDDLRAKGYIAYEVTGKDGSKGKLMTEFDPDAERIILSPPMVGG